MKKKQTPYSCYDDLLRDYYGGHPRPKRKKQKSLTRSFDNGEVLNVKDSVPFEEYVVAASADSNGEIFEEYVVQASVVNDETHFEEYVLQSSTPEENTYVPVYTPPAASPVSEHQELQTNVLDPFSMEKGISREASPPSTYPAVPGHDYDESPDTAALLEDLKQMRGDNAPESPAQGSGSLSSREEEIVNDLQAILSGKKVYDPAVKKTVNREDVGKQQSVDEPATPKGNDPGAKNEHAIFDRIAQNMKFANAYNLGTIQVDAQELANRFNDFDKVQEAPRPPATTRKNAPAPANKKSDEELNPLEFLNDLDDIHRYQSQQPAATGAAEQPASLQMSPADSSGPNWPPRPTSIRPLTSAERAAVFGTFTYEADPSTFGGDGIRVTSNWAADNIVRVSIPQLNGKKIGSQVIQNGIINFHKAGEERLKALWAAWEAAGLLDRILTFEGGYAARFIRGTQHRSPRPLSNHAWGTAFDINAGTNGFGQEPALMGQKGCVRELVAIANEQGFFWGGHFKGKKDGMHFELGKTL